jgi:hypothetical protein
VDISRKLMDDPVEMALKKYPDLNWSHINRIGPL